MVSDGISEDGRIITEGICEDAKIEIKEAIIEDGRTISSTSIVVSDEGVGVDTQSDILATILGSDNPGYRGSDTLAGPGGVTIQHNLNLGSYQPKIELTEESGAVGELWITDVGPNGFKIRNSGEGGTVFEWTIYKRAVAADHRGNSNLAGPGGVTIVHDLDLADYQPDLELTEESGAVGELWITDVAANSFVVRNSGSGITAFSWVVYEAADHSGNSNLAGPGGITITHNLNLGFYQAELELTEESGAVGELWITDVAANSFVVRNTGSGITAFSWVVYEAIAGVDAILLLAEVILSLDTGLGLDAILQADNALLRSETGTGAEAIAKLIEIILSIETGTGTESVLNILSILLSSESGTGTDLARLIFLKGDAGAGAEVILERLAAVRSLEDRGYRGSDNLAGQGGVTIQHNLNLVNYQPEIKITEESGAVGELWITDIGPNAFKVRNSGAGAVAFAWAVCCGTLTSDHRGTSNLAGVEGVTITHNLGKVNYQPEIEVAEESGAVGEIWITDIGPNAFRVRNSGVGADEFAWTVCDRTIEADHRGTSSLAGPGGVTVQHNLNLGAYQPRLEVREESGAVGEMWITDVGPNTFKVRNSGIGEPFFSWIIYESEVDAILEQLLAMVDAGAGTDAILEQLVAVLKAEAGAGIDAILKKLLAVADVGEGADAILEQLVAVLKAEAGAGIDAILKKILAMVDAGAGLDALLEQVCVVADGGAGTEIVLDQLAAVRSLEDRGYSGSDTLAGPGGVTIQHNLNLGSYQPKIELTEESGAVGELWITDVGPNAFKVRNSGAGAVAFAWAVCCGTLASDHRGTSNLAGPGGVAVQHNLNLGDYQPEIEVAEESGAVGEIWITGIGPNAFRVRNSGIGEDGFTWTVYDGTIAADHRGTSSLAGAEGITIQHNLNLGDYQPRLEVREKSGAVGELWVTDVGPNAFKVRNSGIGEAEFSWIIYESEVDAILKQLVAVLRGETGIGAELSQILLSSGEGGVGADAILKLLGAIVEADAGEGLGAIIGKIVSAFDVGVGVDEWAEIIVTLLQSDTGAGVDARLALLATLMRSDTGIGTELWQRLGAWILLKLLQERLVNIAMTQEGLRPVNLALSQEVIKRY